MSLSTVIVCCVLTGLEMVAAIFATNNGRPWFIAGIVTFMILFVVYNISLDMASLTVVTIGWIFTSQIAAVLLDKYYFEKTVTMPQLIGVGVILFGVAIMCIPAGAVNEEKELSTVNNEMSMR